MVRMKEIRLPKEIYSENCIKKAIADYNALAEIDYAQNDNMWEISFAKCKFDEIRTLNEFENYLIELENQ